MTMRSGFAILLLGSGLLCGPAAADDYGQHYRDVVSAYQAEDGKAMQSAIARALAERPEYPPMLEIRAMAHALAGHPMAAVADLDRLLAMRIRIDLDAPAFASLPATDRTRLAQLNEELQAPLGQAVRFRRGGEGDVVPEGFVLDGDDVIVGSIRTGRLLRITPSGTAVLHEPAGRHWSIFGLARRDRELWFVSSDVPEFSGPAVETEASTGLFRLDLDSGKLDGHFLPGAKTLGDLWVDDSNIYLSDAAGGIWSFRGGEFQQLLPAGELVNPQGLVMLDGRLVVADYRGGLVSIDPENGARQAIDNDSDASLYGIDGLATDGRRLFAVQNGIQPARVIAMRLDAEGRAVTAVETLLLNHADFDEPTLLQVSGDHLYVLANSHWNRFDRDARLPEDAAVILSPPTILQLPPR